MAACSEWEAWNCRIPWTRTIRPQSFTCLLVSWTSQHFPVWMHSFYHTFEDNLCRMLGKGDWGLVWWMWFPYLQAAFSCLCCMKISLQTLETWLKCIIHRFILLQLCGVGTQLKEGLENKETLLCLASNACGSFGKMHYCPCKWYCGWLNHCVEPQNPIWIAEFWLTTMRSCAPLRSLFTDKLFFMSEYGFWLSEKTELFKDWRSYTQFYKTPKAKNTLSIPLLWE